MTEKLPYEFDSWEQCRDFYALEALFLGQHYERHKTKGNKRRYMEAARKAIAANRRCDEPMDVTGPWPLDPPPTREDP